MEKLKSRRKCIHPGSALIIAMIFVAIFSTLGLSMLATSSTNVRTSVNHRQANRAFESAHSGLEVVRYLFEGLSISGLTSPENRLAAIYSKLQTRIMNTEISGVYATFDSTENIIKISDVYLDYSTGKSFSCQIEQDATDDMALVVSVIGFSQQVSRSLRVDFVFGETTNNIFDFGIASKGPLYMSGQTVVDGMNLAVESDVYIEADVVGNEFEIGNQASVGGDVHIVDPYGTYIIGNKSSIGGATGEEAEDHVEVGTDPVEFPETNVDYFRQFATGDVIDSMEDVTNHDVLNNVIIAAGTNPTFANDVTINGVLFIEQPNNVTFASKVDVCGIIVGESEPGEISNDNTIDFTGQVDCFDVSTLEGEEFAAIKEEKGTFIMAPGFSVDFSGQSNVINGIMAVAGARFTGQAGGAINGSIVNYSDNPVILQGQGSLTFDRYSLSEVPAGFTPILTLSYGADSYSEVVL
jgi:hypothetical protein